jgi:GLPGLI family protein
MSVNEKNKVLYYDVCKDFESDKLMKFSLQFNDSLMIFSPLKSDNVDDDDYQMNLIYAESESIIYKKKNSNKLLKQNFLYYKTQLIFEVEENYIDWKILDTTKVILGQKCIKAIGTLKENIEGNIQHTFVAWYCPAIHSSYGPRAISGLPGMILELKYKLITFIATKIYDTEFEQISLPLNLPKNFNLN